MFEPCCCIISLDKTKNLPRHCLSLPLCIMGTGAARVIEQQRNLLEAVGDEVPGSYVPFSQLPLYLL